MACSCGTFLRIPLICRWFARLTKWRTFWDVLGKRTIAEFVENDAILEVLREIGVDYAQGYGVGRPQPMANLEEADVPTQMRAVQ